MSYILSTTYPSEHGLVAAEYALGLAALMACPVRLIHAYTVPVTFGEMPLPVMPAEDARLLATEQMDKSVARLRDRYPEAQIEYRLAYGDLTDVLDDAARDVPPLLIVIGNDEEADTEVWIGSHASDMLREAGFPVLAVPHNAVFRQPGHVCIAADGRSVSEGASVDFLLQLQAVCRLRLTVLHMLSDDEKPLVFADSRLGSQLAGSDTAYVEIAAAGGVDAAIAEYAAAHGMDWLAVIPHHYGFWEGLFHRSHTAHMLHLARLPVLALHHTSAGAAEN